MFDSVSSGASDDLKRATELAVRMVGSLGFSEAFGLLSVAGVPKELLGPDIQGALLNEARSLLERSQATCQRLLQSNRAFGTSEPGSSSRAMHFPAGASRVQPSLLSNRRFETALPLTMSLSSIGLGPVSRAFRGTAWSTETAIQTWNRPHQKTG